MTEFTEETCQIIDVDKRLIATGSRVGSLYYLDCESPSQQANSAEDRSKKNVWHHRFGHLGTRNLQQLARDKMVVGIDFDPAKETDFCESSKHSKQPLELIHSDMCGKIGTASLSGAEYFLDDYTHYTWVYVLKRKSQVFECFREWKALVEKRTSQKVKVFRTDNGGEYTSSGFKAYLAEEGIRHELCQRPQSKMVCLNA